MAPVVKNLSANAGDLEIQVWSLVWEDPLEEGMETHSSILAWRNPWTEEPGGIQSIGSQWIRQDWSDLTHKKSIMHFHLTNMVTLIAGNDIYKLIESLRNVNRNHNIRLSEDMNNSIKNFFHWILMDNKKSFLTQMELSTSFCDPMDYRPPGASVREISQARYLTGLPFPSGDLPNPGIKHACPALQADSLPLNYLIHKLIFYVVHISNRQLNYFFFIIPLLSIIHKP